MALELDASRATTTTVQADQPHKDKKGGSKAATEAQTKLAMRRKANRDNDGNTKRQQQESHADQEGHEVEERAEHGAYGDSEPANHPPRYLKLFSDPKFSK